MTEMSRSSKLEAFNSKLESIKQETVNRETFPDFAGQERAAYAEMQRRKQEQKDKAEKAATRDHIPKTTTEYRGTGSIQLPHRAKNEATNSSQLSVPLNYDKKPHACGDDRKSFGKKTCDVAASNIDSIVTGRGSLFAASNCSTFPSWKRGQFG